MNIRSLFPLLLLIFPLLSGCKGKEKPQDAPPAVSVPAFQADSAMAHIRKQCAFGPRVPGSAAHKACGDWIAATFAACGLDVTEQQGLARGYDGKEVPLRNIIARYAPENGARILLCAHWDTRPWADNDPSPLNHHKPLPGANDGASGVAVLLEIARLLQTQAPEIGVDLVCFDAEDGGLPQWEEGYGEDEEERSWCLGSQYFAAHCPLPLPALRYGILLDMVGGRGGHFLQEGHSRRFAAPIIEKLWNAAARAGYSDYFPRSDGGYVTDDHVPLNEICGLPTVDVIPYYEGCESSSFGPTWHTLNDAPEAIDPLTLKAVGQSIAQLLWEEQP